MNQDSRSDLPINADGYGNKLAFGADMIYTSLIDETIRLIKPRILVEVDKGGFLVDGIWTCYRRNYLAVRCQFELQPDPHGNLCLVIDQQSLPVSQFHVILTAKTASTDNMPSTPVKLVQHFPINLQKQKPLTEVGFCELTPLNNENSIPMSREHTFKFQFKIATANNGRRRDAQQQFFNLVMELWCNVIGGDRFKIAERVSAPIIVRGRSPGLYQPAELPPPIQSPVVADQHKYVLPGPGLKRSSQADPAQVQQIHARHLKNESNIGQDYLKKIIKQDEPQDYLPSLEEFQTSGQYNIDSASTEVRDFDNSSISSGSEVFSHRSVATSVTSSAEPADLSNFIVSILLDDEGIKNLCIDGFSLLNPEKFERHLRRTLKTFAKNLVVDSSGKLSKHLGYFLRRHVAALARNVREQVHTLEAFRDLVSRTDQVPEVYSVEQCNGGKDYGSDVDLDDSDLDHDGDGPDLKAETDIFTSVRAKITTSNSFETLREDLLDFVVPFLLNGEMDGQDVQELQKRYSWTSLSDTLAAAIFSKNYHRAARRSSWLFAPWWLEPRWLERYMVKLR